MLSHYQSDVINLGGYQRGDVSFSLHPRGYTWPMCLITGDVNNLEYLVQVVPAGFLQFTMSIFVFLFSAC